MNTYWRNVALFSLTLTGCASTGTATLPMQAEYAGTVVAAERWVATFDVPGQLTERLVEPGQALTAGQVIARLQRDEFDSRARNTEAALRDAVEKSDAMRMQLTAQDLKVVSPGVSVATEPVELRARVLQAVVKTAKADSEARQAQWARGATELRATKSAKLVKWFATPNDALRPGQPIAEMEDDTALHITTQLSSESARGIRVGQRAIVAVPDKRGDQMRRYDAKVIAVDFAPGEAQSVITLTLVELASLSNGARVRVKFL